MEIKIPDTIKLQMMTILKHEESKVILYTGVDIIDDHNLLININKLLAVLLLTVYLFIPFFCADVVDIFLFIR